MTTVYSRASVEDNLIEVEKTGHQVSILMGSGVRIVLSRDAMNRLYEALTPHYTPFTPDECRIATDGKHLFVPPDEDTCIKCLKHRGDDDVR